MVILKVLTSSVVVLSGFFGAPHTRTEPIGRWQLGIEEKSQAMSVAHLLVFAPGLNTLTLPVEALAGLPPVTGGRPETVEFRLREDAGTLTFSGQFDGRQGGGTFSFSPSAPFASELVRRGMRRPTESQLLTLARHQIGLRLLDELDANGYETPSIEALIGAGLNSVDARYVLEMAALGFRLKTVEALTSMHTRGADPSYIRAMAKAGYTALSATTLMAMAVQGIDADYARWMNSKTGRRLTPEELIRVRTRSER